MPSGLIGALLAALCYGPKSVVQAVAARGAHATEGLLADPGEALASPAIHAFVVVGAVAMLAHSTALQRHAGDGALGDLCLTASGRFESEHQ